MHISRPTVLRGLALTTIALAAAACSAAPPAPPVASSVTSTMPVPLPVTVAEGSGVGDTAAACTAMVTLVGIEPPGDGTAPPSAQELTSWVAQVEPPLAVAASNTPPELADTFDVLTAAVDGAKAGTPVDTEDPALDEALATVNKAVYDNCGFPTLDVVNDNGELSGIPAVMESGPVAIEFRNSTDPATASFVLLVARVNDGETAQLADVLDGTADIAEIGEVLAAALPAGDAPGYATAILTPGRYLVASPFGSPPAFAGFIGAEFDVE